MPARDPVSLEELRDIPDPFAHRSTRRPPSPVLPAEPSLTRTSFRRRRRLALVSAIAWIALWVFCAGLRHDIADPSVLASSLVFVLLAASSLALALRPGPRGMPQRVSVVKALLLVAPLGYVLLVHQRSACIKTVPFEWRSAFGCFVLASIMALGPLVAFALALRRTFLNAPILRGLTLGVLTSLGGSIGIFAHCGIDTESHVLVAHGTTLLLGALTGGIFGVMQGRP